MSGHHHHHHGHHHHDHSQGDQDNETVLKRIRFAFILNFVFAIVELVGGLFTGSFAIVADAIHDLGDSFSLALALYLQKKSQGAPSAEMPYGYLRYSVVSAIITGIVIISGSFVVLIEAIQHLIHPEELPNVMGMIGLSIVGIAINGIAALRLSGGHSHNEKILSWHLIEDLLGWIVVLIGAICIYFFQLNWIDPLLAIGISIFISWNVIKNLKEPFRIILQYVPGKEDLTDIQKQIEIIPGVAKVVEIQAWTLDGYQHVLTTRLNVEDAVSTDQVRAEVRSKLKEKGYKFVTIEIDRDEAHSHDHDHGNEHTHDHDHDHDHDHHHEASKLPRIPPC